jgi:hypothetical protein
MTPKPTGDNAPDSPTTAPDDVAALVARLWDDHARSIFLMVLRSVGNQDKALNVCQETFCQ